MKKKNSVSALIICAALTLVYPQKLFNAENYSEYTLQNGMQIFVLEDFSSATIQAEYAVKAGISSQNKDNTGFFPLYTRLFKYMAQEDSTVLKNLSSECNADSSRYRATVTPAMLFGTLENLAQAAFSPVFTDSSINRELSALKDEVRQLSKMPASFINSGIDSRVFSQAPWKQDSGLYPALFTGTTAEQARTILKGISDNWYVPQNSALFITGCISKEELLEIAKATFGKYARAVNPSAAEPVKAGGAKRKFILVDSDFSKDITQIVVQYTSLTMNQCDIAAAAYNADNSSVKKLLLRQRNLAIRDAEYINVASAHKNGSSRLIYQAILEKPVNKKVSLADQAELFVSKAREGAKNCAPDEYSEAKKLLTESFMSVTSGAISFMDYLCQWWAVENLNRLETSSHNLLAQRMSLRPELIHMEDTKSIESNISSEAPFVFVLLNTSVYQANKNAFQKLGYQEITQKNSSWYTQKIEINENNSGTSAMPLSSSEEKENALNSAGFIEANSLAISSFTLRNGIPVTVKNSPSTSNVLILVSLDGGKFYSPKISGFEKVMVNAFASNIQKEINKFRTDKVLESVPEVLCETMNSYSAITVECAKEDASICLKCISDALIFGEITPYEADSYVYSVQTQKRLFNASDVNQLYFRGIKYLYEDQSYREVFDSESDILQTTSYNDILAAYPQFLNAALYRIVIVGDIDTDYLREPLENTLGLLSRRQNSDTERKYIKADFPDDKSISVKLRHLFYTDVKAEEAGPMPAILVPTTNFSDPVQYWLKAPEKHTEAVVFDALACRLKDILAENCGGICSDVKLAKRTEEVPAAAFTFITAEHTSRVFELYEKSAAELSGRLTSNSSMEEIQKIIDSWILNTLQKTSTNRGTAILIRNGGNFPTQYLEDYRTVLDATGQTYSRIMEEFIPQKAPLRIYSTDAKR